MQRVSASRRVTDVDVFPNLSLYRGEESGRIRELHRLYRRGHTVLRTASLGRLIRAALAHLDGFLAPPAGLVPLRGELLVGKRGAVVINDALTNFNIPERRLAKMGWSRTDGAVPLFDPATLELVVPESRLEFDAATIAEISERWPRLADEGAALPGRYPVHAVVLLGARPDHLKVASPARRLSSFASLIDSSTHPVKAADLAALGQLDGRAEVVRALGFETDEIIGILKDLAKS